MLFNSLNYLIFFPIVLVLYWLVPVSLRRVLLLVASYVFYMSWLPIYGFLIFLLSLVNFAFGILIDRVKEGRKAIFIAAIAVNLLTLCYYKYANFLLASTVDFLNRGMQILQQFHFAVPAGMTVPATAPHLDIILPLGISFFVFEFIHYLSDVYKGKPAVSNWIDFSIFAAFFPSQIAGPIKRFQDFLPQLKNPLKLSGPLFEEGLSLIIKGLFKKVALADNLSSIATVGFSNTATIGTADAWIASLCFALQIYFDFSGYTDMGRGSALLMGIRLPENFNLPYIACNLPDFWKRWHISLSTWLRDYLYIPLGGNRHGAARTNINLLTTMLLGGLWHGAAWHFVAWGGFHGAALMLCHKYDEMVKQSQALQRFHSTSFAKALCVAFTFLAVLVGWNLFRANTVSEAFQITMRMFALAPSAQVVEALLRSQVLAALAAFSVYALLFVAPDGKPLPVQTKLVNKIAALLVGTLPRRIALYAGVFIAAIGLSPFEAEPFIYFQF